MAADEIILANGKNIATYQLTESTRVRQVQRVVNEQLGEVGAPLRAWLRNGAAPGNLTLAVDGTAPETFALQPGSAVVYRVHSLVWLLAGAGLPAALGTFADAAGLGNGLQVRLESDAGTLLDLTDGVNIKTNEQLEIRAARVDERLTYRVYEWAFPSPLRFEGTSDNERLEVVVNDDLSGLALFEVMALGTVETSRS